MKQLIKKLLIPTLLIISIGTTTSITSENHKDDLRHLLEVLQKKCDLPTQQKIENHDAIDSEVILDYIQECITYIEKHADDFSSNEIEDILFQIEKYCTSPCTQLHYRNSDKTKTYGSLLVKRKILAGCLAIRGNACINGKTFLNDNVTVAGNIIPDENNAFSLGSSNNTWHNIFAQDGVFNGTLTVANLDLSGSLIFDNLAITNDLTVGNTATIGNGLTVSAGGADITGDITENGNILPNGLHDLGSLVAPWDNLYANDGNFAGTLTAANFVLTNDITVNNATINNDLTVGNTATIGNGLTVSAGGADITGDITEAGNILPDANNTRDIGTPALRWANTYAVDGDFSGTLTAANFVLANDITVNNATINNDLSVGNTATIGNGLIVTAGGADITGDITEAGNILPDANNTRDIGTPALRWANAYAVDGDFSGTLTANNFILTNDITVNNATINNDLSVGNNATITNDLSVDTDTLFVDASTDRVGINTATPTVALDVVGATNISTTATIGTGLTVSAGGASITGTINQTGDIIPTADTFDFGSSGSRWANVFAIDGDFSGTLTVDTLNITNDITVNNATINNDLTVGNDATIGNNLAVDTDTLFVDATNDRVGINTSTPTVALDVVGATNISTTATIGTGLTVSAGGASITGTINQTGDIIPTADTFDFGSSGSRWANVFAIDGDFSGTLTVDTLNITNDITVNNATINNDLTVGNDATIGNNLAVDTDTLFVDATNDRVGINTSTPAVALDVVGATNISTTATIGTGLTVSAGGANITGNITEAGNILPDANNTRDIGTTALRWANIYGVNGNFTGTLTAGSINIPTAQFDTLTVGNGSDPATLNFNSSGASPTDVQLIATGGTGVAGQGNLAINAANTNISSNLAVDTNVLVVNATTNRVGINNATPNFPLDVTGAANITSNLSVDTDTLFVDATNDRVGINTPTPTVALDVVGATNISTTATIGTGLTVSAGGASITGTINQTGDIIPTADTFDFGSSGSRWANVFAIDGDFSGTLTVDTLNITNDITVNNATINNDLTVGNDATIGNNLAVDTDTLFVDATNDRVGINTSTPAVALDVVGATNISTTATIGTGLTVSAGGANITGTISQTGDIIPTADTFDLGSSGSRWANIFAIDGDFSGTLTVDTLNITNDITVNNATINNDLTVGNDATIGNNLAVDTDTLFVDATNDRVGINTATPTVALDVVGATNISTTATIGTGLTVSAGGANITGDITEAGNILPNGSHDIGATGNRWTNIYGVNGNFTGTLTAGSINIPTAQFDTLTVGNGSDPATLNFNSSGASLTDVQLIATGGTASAGQGNLAINAANTNISTNLTVDTDVLVVNASTNQVGINKAVPTVALDVVGATNISTTATVGSGLTVTAGGANITGNITEAGNILPSGSRDIGATGNRWANIYGVNGNFTGTLTTDNVTVNNSAIFNNGISISAGGADIFGSINVTGLISPTADNTYDLGTALNRWSTLYAVNGDFTGTLTANSINIPTAQFDTLTVGNGSDPATLNFDSSGASLTDVQLVVTGGSASPGEGDLAINAANTNISTNLTVDTDVLVVDATNNRVGINNATPAFALDVTGAANITSNLAVDTSVLFVNATTNRVGINTASPTEALDVNGNINFPATSSSATGQIKQNGSRLIHTYGTNNIFFGPNAGNFTLTSANNSGFGANALSALTNGGDNTTFGNLSGGVITSGGFNTTIGSAAGRNLAIGSFNTLIGLQAGNTLMDGSSNTFVGESVGYNTTSAANNTGVGAQCLLNLVNGTFNTSVGNSSGAGIVAGTNNSFFGRNAGATGDFSNATAIGANASVGASNALVLGNAANVGIGTSTPAVKLDVVGAASISGNLAVDTNTLFVDATNNRVGINNAAPAVALDVTGAANITSNLTVDTNTLVVDATNNRVGINITSPQQALDIVGNVQYQPTGTSAPAYRPIGSQNSFGLRIVRGTVSTPAAGAAIIQGEGFSVASTGSVGRVDITFTQAFTTAPTVVATPNSAGNYTVNIDSIITTTGFRIFNTLANTGAGAAANVGFIAIGT